MKKIPDKIHGNLFLPLKKECYADWSNGKRYEVRCAKRQWNEGQLYPGRGITVSRGYGK